MTIAEQFTDIFREEHREVRDLLLSLVRDFEAGDMTAARRGVAAVARATGPHFRYEEESMYPRLVRIFGGEYVDKLLADHDGAIRNARELAELADLDSLEPAQAERAVYLVRQILPHVSDCDGLSIMVETFPDEDVIDILSTRDTAMEKGLDLLSWAGTVRPRSA
ncbi:hemerythrin domain-containing protein [Sphaerimonospora thailandensis]|uniref:Hemerythrin-like domain-containing protein n=1 Tax=Sphaerimonospora thailandensis TaxID=795644 RepID=A0A8J3RDT3_9ACTN|nr:hemerythrin domain-containing protein [Sphaerimonospora thailandensis]GIH73178.1 hypothetical protein Mth01_54310 [Sphaerimonospora thailandensis]